MKLITKIVLLLGISLFLVGCNEIQSEKEISSIAVDQNTLNENYDVESFDLSTIKLIISYDDGTTSIYNY